jgi:DMSO/TMAO reductase YedYZ molybdopterin-dependent catalytic subunit
VDPYPSDAPPPNQPNLRRAGALAAGISLSVLWVLSSWDAVSFAPAALAGALLRAAPGDLATFFIETLGHWARRLLVASVFLAAIAFGAEVLYRTARGGRARPAFAALLLAVVAGAASLIGTSPGALVVPTLIAVIVAAGAYALAAHAVTRSSEPADGGRREFLRLGTGTAAAIAVGGGAVGWFIRRLGGPDTDVALVAPAQRATVPERADFPEIPGLTPEITSAEDHYVVDINLIPPRVEAEGWELDIRGEVDNPMSFDFESLQSSFEVVEEFAVLTCISNEVGGELIGHSRWGGVRLADVLDAASVRPGAMDVVFYAADGYTDSIPVETALHPTVLLAVSQNGQPLTQAHGFPCRVRVPAIYGMKNVKWLQGIEVVRRDFQGYWMQRGWSDEAVIDTEARIDVIGSPDEPRTDEPTWIAGIAWAGIRGISKVEVSVDGGRTWSEAMLKDPISPISWRHWAYRWTPERSGTTMIVCRATDGEGVVQTSKVADPHPDGSTGYPSRRVEVG